MEKGLVDFLVDTSIYVVSPVSQPTHEVFSPQASQALLLKALKAVSSQILELEQGDIVVLECTPQSCRLLLGALGEYQFDTHPETLQQVSTRLDAVALSSRFLRAVLGMWPA